MRALIVPAVLPLAGPALAEQPAISDLVADTAVLTSIRPSVVLLEGKTMGTFVCRFRVTDEDFAAYVADGEIDQSADRVVCIPIEELNN
ncbi:hypothetical protein Q5Y75_00195 [Ruegeria sp. 2205SS24-7]|uniref:hypothetical protein n=1 Tax=Ruegeria discodermiae TaxID=3064389 RepID=UPI002740FDE9|nr:hypothetical protein [Ruegeria sp. 2205SS24-7]MDP5215627.1 hypothetical protein [Ruegeria sp. 2205SS24-7]